MTYRLNRIRMKECTVLAAKTPNCFQITDCSQLIVDMHQTH